MIFFLPSLASYQILFCLKIPILSHCSVEGRGVTINIESVSLWGVGNWRLQDNVFKVIFSLYSVLFSWLQAGSLGDAEDLAMRENIQSSLDFSSCLFSLFNLLVVLQEQEECKGVLLIITPGPRLQLWMEPPQRAPAPPLQQQEDLKSLLLQGPTVRANRWLSAPWQLPCPPGMARLGPQLCRL